MAENKERLAETLEQKKEMILPMTESRETVARVPQEVKTWMQKVEEDPGQMKTVSDSSGQPLLQTASPQKPKIKLPLTKTRFVEGFRKTINEAGRWLSVFILRLIKIKKGQVEFKEEE